MERFFSHALAAVVIMAMTSSTGFAMEARNSYSIGGDAGLFVPGGNENLDAGPLVDLRIGKPLTEAITSELCASFVPTKASTGENSQLYQFQLELLYESWKKGPWRFFEAVGVGGSQGSGGVKSGVLVDFGIGLKYFLTDNVALRTDLRDVIGIASIGNNIQLTAGVSYLFDFAERGRKVTWGRHLDLPRVTQIVKTPAAAAPAEAKRPPTDPAAHSPAASPSTKEAAVHVDAGKTLQIPVAKTLPQAAPGELPQAPQADKEQTPGVAPQSTSISTAKQGGPTSIAREESSPAAHTAAPELESTAAGLTAGPSQVVVYFRTDSWALSLKDILLLNKMARDLKSSVTSKVIIHGHADATGTDPHNILLSRRRTEGIRQHLINRGVPAGKISTDAFGSARPAGDNLSSSGRSKNRRAEVFVVVQSASR